MEANKPLFSKYKKYIVVDPEYLDQIKKNCIKTTDKLDAVDKSLLEALNTKNLNVNQKLNLYREILLSNKIPFPTQKPNNNNNNGDIKNSKNWSDENHHGTTTPSTASTISDNVFESSFGRPQPQLDFGRTLDAGDISVTMTDSERKRLQNYPAHLNGDRSFAESDKSVKFSETDRFEPYTIPSKASRSSWSKYEDIVADDEAGNYASTLSNRKLPKGVGKKTKGIKK